MNNIVSSIQNKDIYVITLKEITDLLEVRHNDAMVKVEKLSQEPSFGLLRKTRISHIKGKDIETYELTKLQAIAVGAKLNDALLMKLVIRLEGKPKTQLELAKEQVILLERLEKTEIENNQLKVLNAKKSQTIANVVHSENAYTASQVAKDMPSSISAILLNKMLNEAGVIFKQNGSWQLYSKYLGHNLTDIKESLPDKNGKTYPSLRWTSTGKDWIYKNWTTVKQRVSKETLTEWEVLVTSNIPKIPMPNKEDRNF